MPLGDPNHEKNTLIVCITITSSKEIKLSKVEWRGRLLKRDNTLSTLQTTMAEKEKYKVLTEHACRAST